MQYQLLNLLALIALTSAAEVETVTENSTVDVTITTCADHPDCTAVAAAVSPAPAASSSEEVIYVDETTTPTVTASTGVEATVYLQSTLASTYSSAAGNDSALAGVEAYEGGANSHNIALGAAGFAGLAALLM